MLNLYFDESGCLGFDFLKKGTSLYFTICVLAICSSRDDRYLKMAVKRTLKNRINRKKKSNTNEFKGSKDSLSTKRYFLAQLDSFGVKYRLYALTLNKRRIRPDLSVRPDRLYNYLVNQLLLKRKGKTVKERPQPQRSMNSTKCCQTSEAIDSQKSIKRKRRAKKTIIKVISLKVRVYPHRGRT